MGLAPSLTHLRENLLEKLPKSDNHQNILTLSETFLIKSISLEIRTFKSMPLKITLDSSFESTKQLLLRNMLFGNYIHL